MFQATMQMTGSWFLKPCGELQGAVPDGRLASIPLAPLSDTDQVNLVRILAVDPAALFIFRPSLANCTDYRIFHMRLSLDFSNVPVLTTISPRPPAIFPFLCSRPCRRRPRASMLPSHHGAHMRLTPTSGACTL